MSASRRIKQHEGRDITCIVDEEQARRAEKSVYLTFPLERSRGRTEEGVLAIEIRTRGGMDSKKVINATMENRGCSYLVWKHRAPQPSRL